MMTPTLDWRPRFDSRSLSFRLVAPHTKTKKTTWRHGTVLDQGSEGACVGFAATQNLQSTKKPKVFPDGNVEAQAIYTAARQVDEWPGEDYSGTSVLAGMKTITNLGFVKRYDWLTSLADTLWALSYRGPVQIGIWWYDGMWEPDSAGFLHVQGSKAGGHSTLLSGINPAEQSVTITNSWGLDWGNKGQAKLSFTDLGKLLADEGEAVSILKL